MDGLKIDDSTDNGRVLLAMSELLEEICSSVDSIDADVDDIVDFCNVLDDDVQDIMTEIFDEDDSDCCDCDEPLELDDDRYEVVCPSCGKTIELTYDMVNEGSIECPNCKELLEFDFDEDSEED